MSEKHCLTRIVSQYLNMDAEIIDDPFEAGKERYVCSCTYENRDQNRFFKSQTKYQEHCTTFHLSALKSFKQVYDLRRAEKKIKRLSKENARLSSEKEQLSFEKEQLEIIKVHHEATVKARQTELIDSIAERLSFDNACQLLLSKPHRNEGCEELAELFNSYTDVKVKTAKFLEKMNLSVSELEELDASTIEPKRIRKGLDLNDGVVVMNDNALMTLFTTSINLEPSKYFVYILFLILSYCYKLKNKRKLEEHIKQPILDRKLCIGYQLNKTTYQLISLPRKRLL